MKRCFWVAVVCCISLFCVGIVQAETITYEGDGTSLRQDPLGLGTGDVSVFPDTPSNNTVIIDYTTGASGTTKPEFVFGGVSVREDVENNTVEIRNGEVAEEVYGGASEYGSATDNTVSITGGTVEGYVYGGKSNSGSATGNTVNLSGGTVDSGGYSSEVVGGESDSGSATGNTVVITGGTIAGNGYAIGGRSTSGSATDNTVIMTGGTVGESVYGGESDSGSVAGNTVNLTGGTVGGDVYGGKSDSGSATGNTVSLTGVTVGDSVYGGYIDSGSGSATGNTVIITGAATVDTVFGGSSDSGSAAGNTVIITEGRVTGNVFGGWTDFGSATGNTVTIGANADFDPVAELWGGYKNPGALGDVFTGNTLNIQAYSGSFAEIANFQNYNFFLPASTGGGPLLTVGNPVELANTHVAITGIERGNPLALGTEVILIDDTTRTPESMKATHVPQGIARMYDFDINATGGRLVARTISDAYLNPQLKSLAEGRMAGLALVNQGADLLVGSGITSALSASERVGSGFAPFASMSGGTSRYKTGSHVDVDGFSFMAGLAWRAPWDKDDGSLMLGAFFETGWGAATIATTVFLLYPLLKAMGTHDITAAASLVAMKRPWAYTAKPQ